MRLVGAKLFVAAMALVGTFAVPPSPAIAETNFKAWVRALWPEAEARGVSSATFAAAFENATPDPKVIDLTKVQPEFNQTPKGYIETRVSEQRIRIGKTMATRWKETLDQVEKAYGVDRYTILAVWGLESNFGAMTGGKNVIRSLATLACCTARRPEFFRAELLTALEILEAHDTDPRHMTGSWAGAMGQTQFMPSSFMKYAVDATGDGHRDIWSSVPDALASTANYLARHDWQPLKTWGYEVRLPAGFDYASIDRHAGQPIAVWVKLGVTRVGGRPFPRGDDPAWLHLPAGARGPAFLALPNFYAIKSYNASDAYALSVGHLADRIRGGAPFAAAWPNDAPLTRDQREALQRRLVELGYPMEKIDGKIGDETRSAFRSWQIAEGLPADGYPTVPLLRKMGAIR